MELNGKASLTTGSKDAIKLSDAKAQLVEFSREENKWIAETFDGRTVTADDRTIRVLEAGDIGPYDFVMGPRSDPDVMGKDLTDTVLNKGYATIKVFVSDEGTEEAMNTASKLEDDEQYFSRMAVEFERGYFGIGGSGKTAHIDSNVPDYAHDSDLIRGAEESFTGISSMMAPHSGPQLGFDIYSRTTLLMALPLADGDEDKYPPEDIGEREAENHMFTMARRRLTVLQFVKEAGAVTLTPAGEGEPVSLKPEAGTILVFANSRFEYTHEAPRGSMVLSTFLLDEPPRWNIEPPFGSTELLTSLGQGPPAPPGEQVVVDAMYCRYGMGADGKHKMWCGVKSSTDGLLDVPHARWDHAPYYDPEQQWGGSYTRHGCFGIDGVELFDCKFFEISPAEAKGMDPCQRQVMEVSYTVLLEGGWDKRTLQRQSEHIGHFVGIDKDDWLCMSSSGQLDLGGAHGAAAAANAITSNRFSYSLNLKGASMTIDTACSSSLICTHVAKLHLRFKDYDPMPANIINGLNLMLFPGPFVGCSAANMLSHEGRSFTFNATADGYARGELCGGIMIKLHQYDDRSYACLAGSQGNQDGRSASLTAPNGPAQERCLNAVLKECRLTPTEVDCFECHGTGTSLGDPIEVGSFRKVMSVTPRKEPLVITSSKSNIAHSEGGAGLAGFFKCCLQVSHCEGCSNVHLRVKNPHLDLDGFPCQILGEVVTLREDSAYCGVSSFGFGGTNAHAEAWGKNIFTTRGASQMDPKLAFEKKLGQAPPAEITMVGDDVAEWETTGLPAKPERHANYNVQLDEDGTVTWERTDDDYQDWGNEFGIRGSHNNWSTEPLDQHDSIQGLWTGRITLGSNGEELFQVVADESDEMIYAPDRERCQQKSAEITGPSKQGKEHAWLVRGQPGDVFRVEFFQQEQRRSILWIKSADES